MDAKIRELTDKIFNEGVEKGQEKANQLIANAEKQAAETIKGAEARATQIIADAERRAGELQQNTHSELKLYANQTIEALKSSIVDSLTDKIVKSNVTAATTDPTFMQQVILKMVQNWQPGEEIVIGTAEAEELERFFVANAKDLLDKGLEIEGLPAAANGFVVRPKDGSYKVVFGEEELVAFFKHFLRPRLVDMLF